MSTLNRTKSYLSEVVLFLCGALILIGPLAISNARIFTIAQGERKRLSKGIVIRKIEDDPVRITSMKVGGTARRFEEEFDDSDDWLRKLSLEIENKWSKPIIHLSVALSFPETDSSGQRMTFPVPLGNRPGSRSPAKRANLLLSPGDKLVINMADYYEWLSQFLRSRHSMSQINKVEIQVELAVFDDKTAWGRGTFFEEDPYKPGRYIPVETKPATP